MYKKMIFIFIFTAFFWRCSDDVNKTPPPAKVRLVEKSGEGSVAEHGIDAVPESDGIMLEWYLNSERTLAGYAIYRSELDSANYRQIAKVRGDYQQIDTSFTDSTVALNQVYYYFIRAFDKEDQYSESSDTVFYQLVEKPVLLKPTQNAATVARPRFQWNNMATDSFYIRIRNVNSNETKVIGRTIKYGYPEDWALQEFGVDSLKSGSYQWRIDAVGGANTGAESHWAFFRVN